MHPTPELSQCTLNQCALTAAYKRGKFFKAVKNCAYFL